MRYYYKDENNNYYSLKEPREDLIQISEEEYNLHEESISSVVIDYDKVYKLKQIREYKKLLDDTDYKFFKYVDGELTEEEWKVIQNQRKEWRRQLDYLKTN